MHDELEPHLPAHRRLAEDRADVQQADAAHFQQVQQQVGAAPFDGVLVDAEEVDRVVGHEAVAARDQLQPELALAQARFARDHHAHAQDVHEHAVHRGALGKVLGQVRAQQVDHEGRRLARGEQRQLGALADRQQFVRRGLAVGQHQHRGLQRDDAGNAPGAVFLATARQVGHLAGAEDLHAVGVDVVEVADEVGRRLGPADDFGVELAF